MKNAGQKQLIDIKSLLPALLVLLLYGLTYQHIIASLIRTWSASEDNSHGFLVVPIFIYMLWQKKVDLSKLKIQGSNAGGVVFVFSLLLFLIGEAAGIKSLVSFSFWFSFVSGVWFLFGFALVRSLAFPLCFLLFAIPVPSQVYAAATGPLQLFVSQVASFFLKASSVPIVCQGNVIEHPVQTFQVVQACSGLRSIMTMLALGAIVAYFGVKKYWLRVLLITTGVPVAILVNIIRVYVLVGFYDWFHLDLAVGTAHTMLGLVVFALSLGLFFLIYKGVARWDR